MSLYSAHSLRAFRLATPKILLRNSMVAFQQKGNVRLGLFRREIPKTLAQSEETQHGQNYHNQPNQINN